MLIVMPDYVIRIMARAVVIRYQNGETDVNAVLDSYNLTDENRALVLARIAVTNPEIPLPQGATAASA